MIAKLSGFGTVIQGPQSHGRFTWVTLGIKVLEGPHQAIRIYVPRDWVKEAPSVQCAGIPFWLRSGDDWHADRSSGYLCFDYSRRWSEHLTARSQEPGVTRGLLEEIAAEWIVTATSFLLHVHYRCYQTGRKEWPSTVEYWEHGDEAAHRQLKKTD